ncbi:hypothetical protein UlMin_039826 [Ulmus minor]
MGAVGGEEQTQGTGGGDEKIFVSIRMRPLSAKEIARNDVSDWECINENTIIYRNSLSVSERSMYPTAYTFDRVFSFDSSTRQVYQEGAKDVALSVVNGINASIFAYGQTSSGKTFTMSGITEYTVADIYEYINKHHEREFNMKFSALEIYNESVRDLLSADSTPLRLLDDPERGTIVERLTEETLMDWNHFKELLSICEAQRQIGETSLNEASSRSHQILRLTIESSAREYIGNDKSSSLAATVNFVDLAGSERASQTLSAGTRLKEGCHINRSLLTLGTVIRKLSKGRNGHVPYRDSKLTRILQSSLGGNARTAVICTLSPARSHVEQSRNTLLFASCATEVSTNAQVNVVMSDKALVKKLQRELSRLENELRDAGKTTVSSDSSALLREKDLQIEKLKKEISEVILQRDLAQSQVKDLLRVIGEDKPSEPVELDHYYPKLRVRNSWDFENQTRGNFLLVASQYQDNRDSSVKSFDTSQNSEAQSSNLDENFFQLPDFDENFQHTDSSPQLSIRIPTPIEIDLHQEETKESSVGNLDDLCKEVQCIEMEEPSSNRYTESNISDSSSNRFVNSNVSSPEAKAATSEFTVFEVPVNMNQELESPTMKKDSGQKLGSPLLEKAKDQESGSPPMKKDKNQDLGQLLKDNDQELGSPPPKKAREPNSFQQADFVVASSEKPSKGLSEKDLCGSTCMKITRSRSCRASLTSSLHSHWFENEEKDETTPPIIFEKSFTGRPEGFYQKVPALNYGAHIERLSRNDSQASARSASIDELKTPDIKSSNHMENTHNSNSAVVTEEKASISCEKLLINSELSNTEEKPMVSAKTVKDVGLDAIQMNVGSPPNWPSEFKRLQREIIRLWHACNVSLVHRTYFFLLFSGDPTDSIYVEVELRRLSFLKDTFSRGNQTVEDGRTLTFASSVREICRERLMLSKQMQKKFSKNERENVYLKWGIGLHTKHRRLQLAHRLWSETRDMDHIMESAAIVVKLVGSGEPEQASKEMFGLRFTPRRTSTRKYYGLKQSVKSLI